MPAQSSFLPQGCLVIRFQHSFPWIAIAAEQTIADLTYIATHTYSKTFISMKQTIHASIVYKEQKHIIITKIASFPSPVFLFMCFIIKQTITKRIEL